MRYQAAYNCAMMKVKALESEQILLYRNHRIYVPSQKYTKKWFFVQTYTYYLDGGSEKRLLARMCYVLSCPQTKIMLKYLYYPLNTLFICMNQWTRSTINTGTHCALIDLCRI